MHKAYSIIILAAGNSSRMGQSKQLLKIGDETLLQRAVKTAVEAGVAKIVVVLGADDKVHAESIRDFPVSSVVNEKWESGMGSSLKAGLKFLMANAPSISGVIVMVCDQPLVTSKHIASLISLHHKKAKPLVASRYSNTYGVPALFTKKYFNQILGLGDNEGAKKIIMTHEKDLALMDLPEAAVDLDTVEDLNRFKSGSVK
jgi:molybdenum cofactor cytidylyltransferase